MAKSVPVKKKRKKVTKKKKRVTHATAKPKKKYFAAIEYNEERFEGNGKTSVEAFEKIKLPSPLGIFKTTIVVRLAYDGKQSEQIFYAFQFRRFVNIKMIREILCKRLEQRLK